MPRIVLFPVAAIALVISLAPMPAGASGAPLISETCQPGVWLGGPIYGFPSSEWVFPEADLVTRLTEGNQIANENCLARRILLGGDCRSVAFTVAGTVYDVVSPGHSLRAAEQKALFDYPRWTADGPFAVDP
jgi:hypothetical protein